MSEEQKVVEEEQEAGPAEEAGAKSETVSEEIKVQTKDLLRTLEDIIREGTAKRVLVMRNDRVLVDIPLAVGVGASFVFAIYMPLLSAIVAVGALFGGCTVRIERDEPQDEE